jgi:hypothetical protein
MSAGITDVHHMTDNRASKYVRQTLMELQGEIDESTVTVETSTLSIRITLFYQAKNQ